MFVILLGVCTNCLNACYVVRAVSMIDFMDHINYIFMADSPGNGGGQMRPNERSKAVNVINDVCWALL